MTADIAQSQVLSPSKYRNTFLHSLRAEIRKLTSLRSTWTTLGVWLAFGSLITIAVAGSQEADINGVQITENFNAILVTGGLQLHIIFALVIGALAVTSEYASNTMRTTMISQSSRLRGIFAKIGAVTVVVGIAAAVIITIFTVIAVTASGLTWTFSGGNTRALVFFWLAIVIMTVITTGIGYVLRSTAGTIVTAFSLVFLAQLILLIPIDFVKNTLADYLPFKLMESMSSTNGIRTAEALSWSNATAVWAAYAAVAVTAGTIRYLKSDA